MKGAESIVATARATGVDVCFANPGTTEMPLVEAFDAVPGVRTVLCAAEGVATGAADGYTRMAGDPASTLLHLGPGFANGIANPHNARRARSPVVNLIGEHATWHQARVGPGHADVVGAGRRRRVRRDGPGSPARPAARHAHRGGGPPVGRGRRAAGAAVASPHRPVIDLQADGSGLYTLQALWT